MISLKENDNMIEFNDINNKLEKLKEWNIIGAKATNVKTLYYKGAYTNLPVKCDVIGYISKITKPQCINKVYETAVILIDGCTHKIAPAYLKQMQSSNFSRFSTMEDEDN